jgi:signal transduction histidine kinase
MMPEQVHFRYRLTRQPATTFTADGTPAEWNEVGDRRSVSFHRLPPGQYTFEIAAAGQTGVWSDTVSALQIKVLPPIWETWGFRLLATAIVTVSIVAIHVGRVRRLRREQARRSAYLQELIDSQERERRRISNEMHDSIGYDLALLKRYAREGRERSDGDEAAAASFDEIVDVADRVDSDMKTIAFALRPYHLDRIGLTRSIEALVPETGGADEPAWSTAIADIDGVFPKELEIHVYRIAQEGVSNVLKHANARRARLTVSRNAEHVEIRIEDDGAGLDGSPEGAVAAATDGMGLIGIRERAQLLGGDVTVDSSHKRGTVIVVRLRTQGAIHA